MGLRSRRKGLDFDLLLTNPPDLFYRYRSRGLSRHLRYERSEYSMVLGSKWYYRIAV
jgi:hypothetical protein